MELMFKNFFVITNSATKYVRIFVHGQIFQVSLLANKAMSLPLEWGTVKFDQQKISKANHSSLFWCSVSEEEKQSHANENMLRRNKTFLSQNKLERLPLACRTIFLSGQRN
jgi:hypothetical protein